MLHPGKLYSFYAIAILSSLFLACLITNRPLPGHEKAVAAARPQNAAFMPLVSNSFLPTEAQEQTRSRVEVAYGNLPLAFEPNRGQTDAQVKFLSRAGNRTLWLTSDEAVLAVGRRSRPGRFDQKQPAATTTGLSQIAEGAPAVLRIRFAGGNQMAAIEGEDKQQGIVSYFAGKPE